MNLTPEMILRGYQANTAALEEMIFVKGKVAIVTGGTSRLLRGAAAVSGRGKGRPCQLDPGKGGSRRQASEGRRI